MATHSASVPRSPSLRAPFVVAVLIIGMGLMAWAVRSIDSGRTVSGSGRAATQVRDVAPFHAVDLAGSNLVIVAVGPAQRVVVSADDNLLDRVTTEVRDGRLVLGTRGSFRTVSAMRVEVSIPALDSVRLTGSGSIMVRDVHASDLRVDAPGSGIVTVSGAADRLEATLDGSGVLRLGDLVAGEATVALTGSGTIDVNASDTLHASVSGTGTISYRGHPANVSREITGSGAIIERG